MNGPIRFLTLLLLLPATGCMLHPKELAKLGGARVRTPAPGELLVSHRNQDLSNGVLFWTQTGYSSEMTQLDLSGSTANDADFRLLTVSAPKLRRVDVTDTQISDAAVQELQAERPDCTVIRGPDPARPPPRGEWFPFANSPGR